MTVVPLVLVCLLRVNPEDQVVPFDRSNPAGKKPQGEFTTPSNSALTGFMKYLAMHSATDVVLAWFESYFSDRHQFVNINEKSSS